MLGAGVELRRDFPYGLDELPGRALGQHRILDDGLQLTAFIGPQADALLRLAAKRHQGKRLRAGEHELDRPPVELGRHRGQQQVLIGGFAAEGPAGQRGK